MSGTPPGPSTPAADGPAPEKAVSAGPVLQEEFLGDEITPSSLQEAPHSEPAASPPQPLSSTSGGGAGPDDMGALQPSGAVNLEPQLSRVPTAAPSSGTAFGPASASGGAGAPGEAVVRPPPPPPPTPTAPVVLDLPPGNVTAVRTAEELLQVPHPCPATCCTCRGCCDWSGCIAFTERTHQSLLSHD